MNDKNRAAGRGGHGAVWGSKKIKAIAVRGYGKPKVAKEGKFREAIAKAARKHRESPVTSEGLPKFGTAVLVNIINKVGIFPTRNFRTGIFEGAG